MIQITSQEQLDKLIQQRINDGGDMLACFVSFGAARSSKEITFTDDGDDYDVYNDIDDTYETIKHDELMQSFPIGEAISKGTFYKY